MNKVKGGSRRRATKNKMRPFDKLAVYGQGWGSGGLTGYPAYKPPRRGAGGKYKGGGIGGG